MTDTHIKRLKDELERAAGQLKAFEEFRSPVNRRAVVILWDGLASTEFLRVAIREDHGTFYQGRITKLTERGNWEVLADDGELVPEVTPDTFVSVRVVDGS